MKTILPVILIFAFLGLKAEHSEFENAVFRAMKSELNRSLDSLSLEGLEKPFYLQYTIADIELSYIGAKLGGLIKSNTEVIRTQSTNLLVGNYQRANNNFIDANFIYRMPPSIIMPKNNDYIAIRRALWKVTDKEYKFAAERYASKISAIANQNISKENLELPDFSKNDEVRLFVENNNPEFEKERWESVVVDISKVFKNYESIHDSHVSFYYYNTYFYFHNSEGVLAAYPVSYCAIYITAETLAKDGQKLFDHVHHITVNPLQLPDMKTLLESAEFIAERLTKLREAPIYDDYYIGPVLLEKQAVSEFFIQQVFGEGNSLITRRYPIFQNDRIRTMLSGRFERNMLELRMGRRVVDRNLTIVSNPTVDYYRDVFLAGSYRIDAQGVVPSKNVLIENGILVNLLNDKTPTGVMKSSTGSSRNAVRNLTFSPLLAPGVIFVSSEEPKTNEYLKSELIRIAKDEDLDYALIIRKFEYGVSEHSISYTSSDNSQMTTPVNIYKVNLNDGSESLVRGAEIKGLNTRSLNRIVGVSKNEYIYNGMMRQFSNISNKGFFHGMPVSVVNPDAILFREAEVQQKSFSTQRLPFVSAPL